MDPTTAQGIIQDYIVNQTNHEHYKKVCDLAEKYEAFIINEPNSKGEYPLNKYLKQFVRREDEDLFEQRKNITKQYTPSICAQIMRPFNKVTRSNRVIKLIDHKETEKVKAIEEKVKDFYGEADNDGVEQFLNERFKTLTFTDPNAWILTSFKPFDSAKETPQTFPHEYSCSEVVKFQIENNKTLWVLIKLKYNYTTKDDKIKEATRLLFYDSDNAYEYKELPKDIKEKPSGDNVKFWKQDKKKTEYAVYTYNHKSERVPLMRVGYVPDKSTKGKTFVNPFHYEALPLLEQFVKVSSELQLGITLHVFPQKISYVDQCDAKGCANGVMLDGKDCEVCQGTGKKHHTTAADIKEIPMPKRMEDLVDASKLAAYIPFPGNVMEFLDKYADKMEKKIMRMVFNSESLVQTQFNTATEAEIDMDSIYDTLHPFGEKYSEFWMFIVNLQVLYLGIENATIWHKFPTDLKLKSTKQLLEELKSANESNAPSYVRESINNDIMDIIYADDQTELSKLRIKNRHFPFPGKSDFEIQNIILNNLATKFKQVLYANFDNIFDEIESQNDKFYQLAFTKQKELVKTEVDKILQELGSNTPVFDLTA